MSCGYCFAGRSGDCRSPSGNSKKTVEFKIGDIVQFGGYKGEVVFDKGEGFNYPIVVDFPKSSSIHFTRDGRASILHPEPLLFLAELPKKKVKKTLEVWANIYPDGHYTLHQTEEQAGRSIYMDTIDTIKLTGEYEVEES